ncbi:MAG TPA: GntR family transcriptional regulator [Gammaproteobacteria bacterium]|nr:GntR family transcriptional regulator [Gammaproteobacteria bacterium]
MARLSIRTPSRPGTLQDQVRRYIEEQIKSRKLLPGGPIDENAVAVHFHSSRTPVREALLILAMQGLVEIRPRSGIYVRRPPAAELVALFEALTEFEAVLVRLAAQRLKRGDRGVLIKALEDTERMAKKNDIKRYEAANAAFHQVIYRSSANPMIVEQVRAIRTRLAAFRLLGFDRPGRLLASHREHQQIVEAILAGDVEAAASAMRNHISNGGQGFVDLVLSDGKNLR